MNDIPKYFTYDPGDPEGDVTFYEVYAKANSAEEAAAFFLGGGVWVRRELLTREEYEAKYNLTLKKENPMAWIHEEHKKGESSS